MFFFPTEMKSMCNYQQECVHVNGMYICIAMLQTLVRFTVSGKCSIKIKGDRGINFDVVKSM